jgi:hypothetical protein
MLNRLNLKISMLSPLFLMTHGLLVGWLMIESYKAEMFNTFMLAYLLFPTIIAFTFVVSYGVLILLVMLMEMVKGTGGR